jgi:nucleotide-binding universal stress UspA family protein
MSTDRAPIVVGFDGSPGAEAALAWALEEAQSREASVRLVYAFGRDVTYTALTVHGSLPMPDLAGVEEGAKRVLAEAAARATGLSPDVVVSVLASNDDAVRVLLDESQRASEVVLGTRHLGAVGSAVLGSVGAAVSARASCPVVVVRGPAGPADEGAAVVVGIDAADDNAATLGYAFEYASRRSIALRAVLCWHPDLLAEMMWRPEQPAPAKVEAWLSEALAGWREKYPDVAVHAGVVRDHPVDGLVAASSAQHLLVVGAHGRHALTGTLLGSVSQGVLHHATCPVAVVPLPER